MKLLLIIFVSLACIALPPFLFYRTVRTRASLRYNRNEIVYSVARRLFFGALSSADLMSLATPRGASSQVLSDYHSTYADKTISTLDASAANSVYPAEIKFLISQHAQHSDRLRISLLREHSRLMLFPHGERKFAFEQLVTLDMHHNNKITHLLSRRLRSSNYLLHKNSVSSAGRICMLRDEYFLPTLFTRKDKICNCILATYFKR